MLQSVRFHPEAENELNESIVWYQHQQKGLEFEFIRCIDEAIEKLKRNPELYPIIYKKFRKVVVRHFPFIVLYEFDKLEIRILGVFHSRRNPKRFKKRSF